MASREAVWRRFRGARASRSRTTSDFEILRPRDSASMSATSGSGSRTVRVFMKQAYYIYARHARQPVGFVSFFQTTGDLTRSSY